MYTEIRAYLRMTTVSSAGEDEFDLWTPSTSVLVATHWYLPRSSYKTVLSVNVLVTCIIICTHAGYSRYHTDTVLSGFLQQSTLCRLIHVICNVIPIGQFREINMTNHVHGLLFTFWLARHLAGKLHKGDLFGWSIHCTYVASLHLHILVHQYHINWGDIGLYMDQIPLA